MAEKLDETITLLEIFFDEWEIMPLDFMLVFLHIAKNDGMLSMEDLLKEVDMHPFRTKYAVSRLATRGTHPPYGFRLIEKVSKKKRGARYNIFKLTKKGKNLIDRLKESL